MVVGTGFVQVNGNQVLMVTDLALNSSQIDEGSVERAIQEAQEVLKVRNGIESELAKKIQKFVKESKLKLQASIQGDAVRISGAKKDDLQAAMALIRKEVADFPLSFNNFRD